MTRRSFAALAGFVPLRAPAATREEQGKQALDDCLRALGGDHFLRMRTRAESGRVYSFYHDRLSGLARARIYTQYTDDPQPGKLGLRERQSFGKKSEDYGILFIDGAGYEVNFKGVHPLEPDLVERYRQSTWHSFFYILRMRLKEPGLIFELSGRDVIENQSVDILNIYDTQNENVTVYISSTTKLPVRQRFYRRDPVSKDRFEEVTRFSKYRLTNSGLQWPLDLQRERDTEKITEIFDESVVIDPKLAQTLFELPQGIQILSGDKR